MKILFVGAIDFSRHCLEHVLINGGDVVGVITLSAEHASFNSDYADLQPVADRHGIALHHVKKISDPSSIELVKRVSPDVIFVFGWSQLVPKEILDLPPLGCIGTHPALLPLNRGRHPLIWALVKGYRTSGLTFFYLEEGADTGDILWQRPFTIDDEDDAGSLYGIIKGLASDAIAEFLPQLQNGTSTRTPQDHSKATYLRKRNQKDGEINWEESSRNIYNLVRGLTHPYIGAHTYLDGRTVKVWTSQIADDGMAIRLRVAAPGTVLSSDSGNLFVETSDGYLKLIEYQTEDGSALEPGVRLGI